MSNVVALRALRWAGACVVVVAMAFFPGFAPARTHRSHAPGAKYVTVTVTDAAGHSASVEHNVVVTTSTTTTAPSNTALPVVSGTTSQGQTLSTSTGSWNGSPTSYAYQWQDCDSSGASCANVSGATSSSYPLGSGDVGHTIRAVVTATNAGGSGAASSAQTAVVAAGAQVNCFQQLAACGYPDAGGNDGAHGTLTPASGTVFLSTPGETYQNVDLSGSIVVAANNVTINNVRVTTSGEGIFIQEPYTGTLIENTTIRGVDKTANGALADGVLTHWDNVPTTGKNLYIYNSQSTDWNGAGAISDSYMIVDSCPVNSSCNGNHDEAVFVPSNDQSGAQLNHDSMFNINPQTAAIFISGGPGSTMHDHITNSIFGGGGHVIYGANGATDGPASDMVATNNRFVRCLTGPFSDKVGGGGSNCSASATQWGGDSNGYFPHGGYWDYAVAVGSAWTWSGNVWDDNNAALPHP